MTKRRNISDPEQISEQKIVEENLQFGVDEDVRKIMNTKEGRRFFYRYIVKCGVFTTSFTGNSTTFYNEGRREVGLWLLADINRVVPEQYHIMINEAKAEETKEQV